MQTDEEVERFESVLNYLRQNADEHDLQAYHLILDDQCQHPEIMFGLVHFLETFDIEQQLTAFIEVMPQLMVKAPQWAMILHQRILNDLDACKTYQKILQSMNSKQQHFLYYLLEESVKHHPQKSSISSTTE
jgi:hypothetical protein